MPADLTPCMFDHSGRRLARWLPEMQSTEFLRAAIARGERTDECWAVLQANRQRVYAGRAAVTPGVATTCGGKNNG
jgi:hypothetical protein